MNNKTTKKNSRTFTPFNLRRIPAVLLTLVFICLLFFTAGISKVFAQQNNSASDFEFDWDPNVKDGIVITKYVGSQKDVRIPPTIQNIKVTSIGGGAFQHSRNITSVVIPSGVISIADSGRLGGAFQNCPNLASVTIPNSVTMIGAKAFSECPSLASIVIPNSVTTIGDEAFNACTGLARVTIGSGVASIKRRAFIGCTGLTSIIIPRNVTRIEANAFKDCTNLTSVTFQATIVRANFGALGDMSISGVPMDLFPGDLAAKYVDPSGGPGTYIRLTSGQAWRKQ
jgi:hypothetical protein